MISLTKPIYSLFVIILILFGLTDLTPAWCDSYRLKKAFPAFIKQWFFNSPKGICIDNCDYVYVVDQDNDCVKKFHPDGSPVLSFGQYGVEPGCFNGPTGIAFFDQAIFVVDTYNHRIGKFSTAGKWICHWGNYGTKPGCFDHPQDIAIDQQGAVYIADTNNCRIQKFTDSGIYLDEWGQAGNDPGEFEYPTGIAIDQDNCIYVIDPDLLRLQMFSFNGNLLAKYDRWGTNSRPNMISIDALNQVYISTSGNYIEHYNADFLLYDYWGQDGTAPGEFNMPWKVTTSSNGTIYVSDTQNHRIQVFANTDTFMTQWNNAGSLPGMFHYPKGMAVGSNDCLYVVDTKNYRVQQLTKDGQFLSQWGELGYASEQFQYPIDIALDQNNRVYVADAGNYQVKIFSPEGNFISAFGSWGLKTGQFDNMISISVYQDHIWVMDHASRLIVNNSGDYVLKNIYRLQQFSLNGQYIATWQHEDIDGSTAFSSFTFMNDSTILLPNLRDHSINAYTITTNETTIDLHWHRAWGESQLQCPQDIVLHNSTVLVADSCLHTIQTFSADGHYITSIGQSGNGPGELNTPEHLFVDSSGDVYVSDENHRVQVFQTDTSEKKRRAIILTGDGSVYEKNKLLDYIHIAANAAINALKNSGYRNDEILYLSNLPNQLNSDIVKHATLNNLEQAVMLNDATEILIYMVGQGNKDQFILNENEAISPQLFEIWCQSKSLTIIADFLASDAYLNQICHENCMTIASAASIDTITGKNPFIFSSYFWNTIFYGDTLEQAFLLSSQSAFGMHRNQYPTADTNANGIPNETQDFQDMQSIQIGNTRVCPTRVQVLSLTANFSDNQLLTVMVQVSQPATIDQVSVYVLPESQAITPFEMKLYQIDRNHYYGQQTMNTCGRYQLTTHITQHTGMFGVPESITIEKLDGPDPFENDTIFEMAIPCPPDGVSQHHGFHVANDVDWISFEASKGQTYVIETLNLENRCDTVIDLFASDGFTKVWETSLDSGGIGNGEKQSFQCSTDGTYYIRIKQHHSDIYGQDTHYDVRIYVKPSQTNRNITGIMIDSINHQPISNSLVAISQDITAVTNTQGEFFFFNQAPGVKCLTVTANGYHSYTQWIEIQPNPYTNPTITSVDLGNIVLEPVINHIDVQVQGNGWVYPDGHIAVRSGGSLTFQITSDTCSELSYITMDTLPLPYTRTDHVLPISDIQKDSLLTFNFFPGIYTIRTGITGNGELVPDNDIVVPCGNSQSFSMTPASGHYLDHIIIDYKEKPASAMVEFENIQTNHTIEPVFAPCFYDFLTGTTRFDEQGGSGILVIASPEPCERIFPLSDPWISIHSVISNANIYTVHFVIPAMNDQDVRTGKIFVGDNTMVISQSVINNQNNITIDVNLKQGWNLVSLPDVIAYTRHFPDAKVMFQFAGGTYQQTDQMLPGIGYWIKNTIDGTYSIEVKQTPELSMSLTAGWHLIGGTTNDMTTLSTIPDNVISAIYTYEHYRYEAVVEIEKGRGYWIKVTDDCELLLE
jgi:hypothetical protein